MVLFLGVPRKTPPALDFSERKKQRSWACKALEIALH
jgi:hypothetical protein